MQNTTYGKYLAWVTILIVFINATQIIKAQDNQSPPYLYYYSGIVNAFIIERADGTDSRILAQGVMPRNHNAIHEPTWSPSGQWLAWRSARDGGFSRSSYSGWIISSDGSRRLTMLDHPADMLVYVSDMEWASDTDLLFVSEVTADENRENAIRRSLLIDATEEKELASYTFETTFPDDPIAFAWLPNNQGVAVLHRSYLQDEEHYLLYLTLLLTDGTVRSATYPAETSLGLSPDGKLAYISPNSQLMIENLLEEETQAFMFPRQVDSMSISQPDDRLDWNPTQNVAMYIMRQGNHNEIHLLDFATQTTSLIMAETRAEIALLPVPQSNWSADGEKFLFFTTDVSPWIFDLTNASTTQLENIPSYRHVRWSENSQQLLLRSNRGITVYDILSQQSTFITQIIEPSTEEMGFIHSFAAPDGGYIGLTSNMILRVDWGVTATFSAHSASTTSPFVHHYDWHSDGSWVITTSNMTEGCCGANTYMILKGHPVPNFRRELTVFWGEGAGWIPNHVSAHLAQGQRESVLQQPDHTYRFDSMVTAVAWTPDENNLIAVTSSGNIFVQNLDSPVRLRQMFTANIRCGVYLYPPCPVYWEDDRIVIGNRAWDTVQEIVIPAENEALVECFYEQCMRALVNATSANGRWLAQVSSRRLVEIIDQQSGEIIHTFELQDPEIITSMEWVNDKLVMNAASDIIIFSPETRERLVLESEGYTDHFYRMEVSPNGQFVAGASITNEIHIWEIETGEIVTVFNWYAKDIAFSPDGRWLAAGNTDLVTVWDLSDFIEAE